MYFILSLFFFSVSLFCLIFYPSSFHLSFIFLISFFPILSFLEITFMFKRYSFAV